MRRIIHTRACCLRSLEYRESSRLVTLLTEQHGVITAVARGARRPRSQFGAALDRFALSKVVYYWRENRQLYNLSDAELLRSFSRVALDPERFLAAEQLLELSLRTLRPHDPNINMFRLLVTYLSLLDSPQPLSTSLLVTSFFLKAASFLGFRPELRRCISCRSPIIGQALFDTLHGGTLCTACGSHASGLLPLTGLDRALLLQLLQTPAVQLMNQTHAELLPDSVSTLVLDFIRHQFAPVVFNSLQSSPALRETRFDFASKSRPGPSGPGPRQT